MAAPHHGATTRRPNLLLATALLATHNPVKTQPPIIATISSSPDQQPVPPLTPLPPSWPVAAPVSTFSTAIQSSATKHTHQNPKINHTTLFTTTITTQEQELENPNLISRLRRVPDASSTSPAVDIHEHHPLPYERPPLLVPHRRLLSHLLTISRRCKPARIRTVTRSFRPPAVGAPESLRPTSMSSISARAGIPPSSPLW
ncbi:putative basic proline-rich protein-like [Iris pallida]|uniref:Basic proline-rich protein-like n=1 Tax=Iris pallida TaxID=29817 RepID=A0AAX6GSS0_IRIPA|nr:putative basic proline-rich protein-like [Iris pallida]